MVNREEFDELRRQMEECKLDVHKDIKELKQGHKTLSRQLDSQSEERKAFNMGILAKFDEMLTEFRSHTDDEMDTIKDIYTILTTLSEQTAQNTGFISSAQHNKEVEDRVSEKLQELNAPRYEMWKKIKLTAVSVATVAIMGAMGTAIMFMLDMYTLIHGGA